MSNGKKQSISNVQVYTDGKLVRKQRVKGGPAPGYAGKRKASAAAKAARRKAG